jgi:hypothetical protein
MQLINRVADRMVSALVPKITAEAHPICTPYSYYNDSNCGCVKSTDQRKARLCYVNEACEQSCGACLVISNEFC